MTKDRFKILFKILLGSGLVVYVLRSKMIDFEVLRSVLFHPINCLVSLVFLSLCALCCAARWFLLARAQGLSLSFKDMVELTMIGNFFNTFMPGSVGGDVIKAWYVAGQEPTRKTRAIFTVLLDRAIGLSVIVFYAASTLIFYTHWLSGKKELQLIAYSIWGFTATSILIAVLFFTPMFWRWSVSEKIMRLIRRSSKLTNVLEAALLYRNYFATVSVAVLLSGISILGTNILYSIQGASAGIEMDLARYFFVVPIGLTVSAIPVLPGGIGVGQVAFFTLFSWVGANPEQGATLATLMQVYTILFNCIGAFFYFKFKRRPSDIVARRPVSMKQAGQLM